MVISSGDHLLVGCESGTLVEIRDPLNVSKEILLGGGANVRQKIWRASYLNPSCIISTSTYGGIRLLQKEGRSWSNSSVSSKHANSIFAVNNNTNFLALGDYRGYISIWSNSTPLAEPLQYLGVIGSIEDIDWRNDNSFAAINSTGQIDFFEKSGKNEWSHVLQFNLAESPGKCLRFGDEGKTIFAGTQDHIIQLDIDSQQGQLIDIKGTRALFFDNNSVMALTEEGLLSFEVSPVNILPNQVKYQYSKVSLIGKTGTGKTTLCSLIVTGSAGDVQATFGKRIWNWVVTNDSEKPIRRVILHDHGGQESIIDTFLPFLVDSDVILLFFKKKDITTYKEAINLLEEIRLLVPTKTKVMMVETFIDEQLNEIDDSAVQELIDKNSIGDVAKLSSKTGEGIKEFKKKLADFIPWESARTVIQSSFVETLMQSITELYSKNTTTMTFNEFKEYYEIKNHISTVHLRFLLEQSSIQGLIEYYPKPDIVIFNDEQYNKIRTDMAIYVEHAEGIISFSKLLEKFGNNKFIWILDSVYLNYGISYANGDLRIFPSKLTLKSIEIPKTFREVLDKPKFTGEKLFSSENLRIDNLIGALSELKLQCVSVTKQEGLFSWENNATIYFAFESITNSFSKARTKVSYRIGGLKEKTCERLMQEFPAILANLFGEPLTSEEAKKKLSEKEYDYDACISYAGEDREYVRKVAEILESKGLNIFYDEFMQSQLWGKDLTVYLRDVYFSKSKFCIMFISHNYVNKAWPSHERKSALEKQITCKEDEYILPARFDDTEVPGLSTAVGYLDAKRLSPKKLAEIFLKKWNSSQSKYVT
jgi:hypothetical protein